MVPSTNFVNLPVRRTFAPHFGQDFALVLISFEHSLHLIIAMGSSVLWKMMKFHS